VAYGGEIGSELRADRRRRPSPSEIGERVRQLRIARGLTQGQLGLGRVSKEYVSQIERGRARPSSATLEWLADRLGVDRLFLEAGISSPEQELTAGLVARAEAAVAARSYEAALECLEQAGPPSPRWESAARGRGIRPLGTRRRQGSAPAS
jgi:transcriptional regulator with XRE-family HTH domain